jgi:hypothetical protein
MQIVGAQHRSNPAPFPQNEYAPVEKAPRVFIYLQTLLQPRTGSNLAFSIASVLFERNTGGGEGVPESLGQRFLSYGGSKSIAASGYAIEAVPDGIQLAGCGGPWMRLRPAVFLQGG